MRETVLIVVLVTILFLIGATTILVISYAIGDTKQLPTISGRLIQS